MRNANYSSDSLLAGATGGGGQVHSQHIPVEFRDYNHNRTE